MCGKQGSNFLRNTTAHSFRRISAAVRMSTGGIIAPRTVGMATAEGVLSPKRRWSTKEAPHHFGDGVHLWWTIGGSNP